jgi:hypothetical protein
LQPSTQANVGDGSFASLRTAVLGSITLRADTGPSEGRLVLTAHQRREAIARVNANESVADVARLF